MNYFTGLNKVVLSALAALIITGCNGAGGSSNTVSYSQAVRIIRSLYPIPITKDWDETRPAYRDERQTDASRTHLVKLPGGLTVKHEELIPDQEYMITIIKAWKTPPSRKTTVTITKLNKTSCDVQVESVHWFGPNTTPKRDLPYEEARMQEIAQEMLIHKK